MTDGEVGLLGLGLGTLEWVLLIWAVVWLVRRRLRKRVSRNRTTGTGPKWEQAEPYPECFDNYTESESDI